MNHVPPQHRDGRAAFALLFAGHPLPMWIYDLETLAFLEVNEAAVLKYGYSRAEFLGMHITDIRPVEDVERLLAEAHRDVPAIQYSGEWRHTLRDGRIIDVEITSGALRFGDRTAALVVASDITDRKRAEEARTRLAAIVESSDDAIISTTLDGTVVTWNAGAERLYGYTAAEMIGRSMSVTIPTDRTDELPTLLDRTSRGEILKSVETQRRRKDGAVVDVSIGVSPLRDSRGQIVAASAIIRDITERKQTEAELNRVRAEIESQRQHIFRATMTTVHHIVNNALSSLQLVRLQVDVRLTPDERALFDTFIQNTTVELKALGDLQTVRERDFAIGAGIDYPSPKSTG